MFAVLVIYFRQLLPTLVPMSFKPVPFAVFVAYFRHLLAIGPLGNRFSGKSNFLVWKVIKLVTVLSPFLERFDRNLFVIRPHKREGDNKKEGDYFFHGKELVVGTEKAFEEYSAVFLFWIQKRIFQNVHVLP